MFEVKDGMGEGEKGDERRKRNKLREEDLSKRLMIEEEDG